MTTSQVAGLDFAVWLKAPQHRTEAYFPTYASVSRAMQAALRQWVREWFQCHPDLLPRRHTAYSFLVYMCTNPFAGKPTYTFTYESDAPYLVDRALRSAASNLRLELKKLDTKHLPLHLRERYYPYRYKDITGYISKEPRTFYRMLNAETALVNAMLKLATIDGPSIGLEKGLQKFRSAVKAHLGRFSNEFDLRERTEQLVDIATAELAKTMPHNFLREVGEGATSSLMSAEC
jgi:hypothetical protein